MRDPRPACQQPQNKLRPESVDCGTLHGPRHSSRDVRQGATAQPTACRLKAGVLLRRAPEKRESRGWLLDRNCVCGRVESEGGLYGIRLEPGIEHGRGTEERKLAKGPSRSCVLHAVPPQATSAACFREQGAPEARQGLSG